MKKTPLIIALSASLISILNFIYLSYVHYGTKFGLTEGKSLCNINQKLNCDAVAVSKYASIFDIPISNLGATANLIIAFLLLIFASGLSQNSSKILRYSIWISFFSVVASVVMGLISTFILGTFCLFCVFSYALSFIQFFFILKLQEQNNLFNHLKEDVSQLFSEYRYVLVFFIAVPTIAWLSHSMILSSFGLNRINIVIQESLETWKTNPQKTFSEDGIRSSSNPPTKITIVEFADFLCPHCRLASKSMHQFIESRAGVRLILKPFPLDGNCNTEPAIQTKGDNVRCQLAYAALCAANLFEKGTETSEAIFERQTSWNRATFDQDLEKMLSELKLDSPRIKECMQSSQIHELVLRLTKEGAGIMGTPTFYVNGKELPHGQFIPVLDSVLNSVE